MPGVGNGFGVSLLRPRKSQNPLPVKDATSSSFGFNHSVFKLFSNPPIPAPNNPLPLVVECFGIKVNKLVIPSISSPIFSFISSGNPVSVDKAARLIRPEAARIVLIVFLRGDL